MGESRHYLNSPKSRSRRCPQREHHRGLQGNPGSRKGNRAMTAGGARGSEIPHQFREAKIGKRSQFLRQARDLYKTPREPILLLSPFLRDVESYAEPFVGDGAIVRTLSELGHELAYASDIQPEGEATRYAEVRDALTLTKADLRGASHVISNPPWPMPRRRGEPTVSFIRHLCRLAPTWLLLPADFAHNAYAADLIMLQCDMIVSVGRVKWIADSDQSGKENTAWFRFRDDLCLGGVPGFIPLQRPVPYVRAAWMEDLL